MGKNLLKAKSQIDENKNYEILEAIELAKKVNFEKFDSSFRVSLALNLDPKHAEQNIRGSIVLPNGTGKVKKILAIVEQHDEEIAKKAGADFVGGEELLEKIKVSNWFDFDVIITTPSLMPKFAKYGKLLGTKGLMPNPKLGTVTGKIEKAIEDIKKGSIEYKTDSSGNVNLIFGKKSFDSAKLVENFKVIFNTLKKIKPSTVKGEYIKNVSISTSMGPGIRVLFEK